MKILLSVILMLVPLTKSMGQAPAEITVDYDIFYQCDIRYDLFCTVSLDFKNSTYEIEFTWTATDDQFFGTTVSIGYFKKINGILHFSDVLTGLKMTAKQTDDNIVFINAMPFLKILSVLKFEANDIYKGSVRPCNLEYTHKTAKQKREQVYNKTLDVGDVSGTYIYGGDRIKYFRVNLNKDKTFVIKIFDQIAAKGMWAQDNNIIRMADADVECDYYLIVTKDRVGHLRYRSMLLPGDTNAWELDKEE